MRWQGLSQLYGHLSRAHRTKRLRSAYVAVFSGQGEKEDAEIVLSDLASFCDWFSTGKGMSDAELREMNGRRQVYEQIFTFLRMTEAEVEELAEAARADDAQKGDEQGDYL
ncbi:MAG: hypothetical protein QNJ92_06935 [Alphaproteobacteria bacterium]|nr:hypothetical protein [Alphaproteobacteria bacterium]